MAAAFLLRVIGIGYGLPESYHRDEPAGVQGALALVTGAWPPRFFAVSPFVVYGLFGLYGAGFAAGKVLGFFGDPSDFAVAYLKEPAAFYLAGRFVFGVVFGTATVALAMGLGRRLAGARAGLWAGAFLGAAPIHVRLSHYLHPDAAGALAAARPSAARPPPGPPSAGPCR
jgi:hypothetical protein